MGRFVQRADVFNTAKTKQLPVNGDDYKWQNDFDSCKWGAFRQTVSRKRGCIFHTTSCKWGAWKYISIKFPVNGDGKGIRYPVNGDSIVIIPTTFSKNLISTHITDTIKHLSPLTGYYLGRYFPVTGDYSSRKWRFSILYLVMFVPVFGDIIACKRVFLYL